MTTADMLNPPLWVLGHQLEALQFALKRPRDEAHRRSIEERIRQTEAEIEKERARVR